MLGRQVRECSFIETLARVGRGFDKNRKGNIAILLIGFDSLCIGHFFFSLLLCSKTTGEGRQRPRRA
jgi:hypothetical protein